MKQVAPLTQGLALAKHCAGHLPWRKSHHTHFANENIFGEGLFFFFVVLEIRPRASCMLGKHCTTELHPQTQVRICWKLPFLCSALLRQGNLAVWISGGTESLHSQLR
jgi:hypothetical protein